MKWYGPPPWSLKEQDRTSEWQLFLQFHQWHEKQEKKAKKIAKMAEAEKKKKEAEKFAWPNFTTAQMCIMLVAVGPFVAIADIAIIFYLLKKLGEVIGLK